MKKFSGDSLAQDPNKNPEMTAIVRILDALACFQKDSGPNQLATLKMIEVVMPNDGSDSFEKNVLSQVITPNDLAYYICLAALNSCDRKELRETVLKSTNFVVLTSPINNIALIIEHFLNGNYMQF